MADTETPIEATHDLERRLATILCADVAGYSRMMGEDEERTVRVFRGHREIFESLVAQHRGRIFNTAGDALLAEFSSAVEAVRCATDIQSAIRTRNDHLAPEERMQFRIGVNLGDVILQGGDLLGDGVNVAARIQAATEPGGICISGSVYEQIQNKLSLDFKLLGELAYKNIAKPVRTYTINEGAAVTPTPRASWKRPAAAAAAAAILGAAGYWTYGQFEAQRAERARMEAQLAAQKIAADEAQRAAETARREAQIRAEKQSAEEALRRVEDERNRVAQDLKALEAEKRAAGATKARPEAVAAAPGARYDGLYNGRLCNRGRNAECWPVALTVRGGVAEGSWLSRTKGTSEARGTVDADGAIRLNLSAWTRAGTPTVGMLVGRVGDDAIAASGKWREGGVVVGEWRRGPAALPASARAPAQRNTQADDGTYEGRLCNLRREKAPICWPVALAVRNGAAEASWVGGSKKTSMLTGTIAHGGQVEITLHAWTRLGAPTEAILAGRAADGAIVASGRWLEGGAVRGEWKRAR